LNSGANMKMIEITEKEFQRFATYIKTNYGIHLKPEKHSLVSGRLNNVMKEGNFSTLSDYLDYVIADKTGSAASVMLNKITTNHTFFMREPEHFNYFSDKVLPYLKATVKNKDLRIWSAACSSGEEPYTLAMIMDDFFGREKNFWDTKILATDISEKVLGIAQSGIYSSEKVSALPAQWQRKHFTERDGENLKISDRMRNEVIFRKFNLIDPNFPFKKKFHVIFCRNVMIYFDNKTKTELVQKFYDITERGGYLFVGHAESLNRDATGYKYVMPAVYRKE
jgi:chemotaxis protein methyltransferase CheR